MFKSQQLNLIVSLVVVVPLMGLGSYVDGVYGSWAGLIAGLVLLHSARYALSHWSNRVD